MSAEPWRSRHGACQRCHTVDDVISDAAGQIDGGYCCQVEAGLAFRAARQTHWKFGCSAQLQRYVRLAHRSRGQNSISRKQGDAFAEKLGVGRCTGRTSSAGRGSMLGIRLIVVSLGLCDGLVRSSEIGLSFVCCTISVSQLTDATQDQPDHQARQYRLARSFTSLPECDAIRIAEATHIPARTQRAQVRKVG